MNTHIEKPRDLVAGMVIFALGAGFFLSSQSLAFGTAIRMGPGYFPTILSVLLMLLGIGITLLALRHPYNGNAFGKVAWRGVLLVLGSTILFGLTIRGLGIAPTVAIIILISASASHYARVRTALPLAICLAAFCCLVFIKGLGLPLPVAGPWLTVEFWWSATSTHSR
ncbi:tripartite tricarboxylate transporter TctB family protein [Agrobacterium sp. LAD9]|uniref:tripartite tricarboxylate transporter TctB family protein n=1 Tax=Agrobacterium sp. LAD9 TaxID=2055153 RepID=UPI001FCEC5FC|nr:tripartite tricarboxylate transporter TctB family protein [Agrobacterium sp. LAD9]